jgi:hypothetical protein
MIRVSLYNIIQANERELTFRKDCCKEQTANKISEKDWTRWYTQYMIDKKLRQYSPTVQLTGMLHQGIAPFNTAMGKIYKLREG